MNRDRMNLRNEVRRYRRSDRERASSLMPPVPFFASPRSFGLLLGLAAVSVSVESCVPLASTGRPRDLAQEARAGSRLSLRRSAPYDAVLDTTCSFDETARGTVICRPRSASWDVHDATCAKPLTLVRAARPERFIRRRDGSFKPSKVRFYRAGARVSASSYGTRLGGGECVVHSVPSDYFLVEDGEEVEEKSFPRGRTVDEPLTADIATRWAETDDGARFFLGYRALAFGVSCEWELDGPVARCVPASETVTDGVFSDAACRRPAVIVAQGESPPRVVSESHCPRSLYRVTAPAPSTYERSSDTVCDVAEERSEEVAYAVGDRIAPGLLPTVPVARDGSGQLVQQRAVLAGVDVLTNQVDVVHEYDCVGRVATDGRRRCLPDAIAAFYADPTCTIAAEYPDDCTGTTHRFARARAERGDAVVELRKPDVGPVFTREDGRCVARKPESRAIAKRTVPPTELAEMADTE